MEEEVTNHFILLFKRHVKYVGHARVNHSLGFYWHLEVETWAKKEREGSGTEECGRARHRLGQSVCIKPCETGSIRRAVLLTYI